MRTFSEPLTDGAGSAFFLLHEKNIRLKTAVIIEKIFLHMLLNYLKNASFSSNLPLLKKRRFFSKQRFCSNSCYNSCAQAYLFAKWLATVVEIP